MLLPLVGGALAGIPPDWLVWPVTAELHPVGWNYGTRYQAVVESTVGSTRSSPAFSAVVATADVHWRLVASSGEGLWLDEGAPADWRDAALAAALLSGSRVVDETVARAPTVDAFYTAFDTVLNPSLHLQRQRDGDFVLVHRAGGRLDHRLDQAESEIAAPDRRRPPSVDLGLDWHLRDADDPPRAPFLDYGAFVSLSEMLVSNMRLDVLALAGQWSFTARQRVYPRVYALLTARSANADAENPTGAPLRWDERALPRRWSVGLIWNLPTPGWTLRGERIEALTDGAVTWQLTARAEFGAFAPGRIHPALGARDPDDAWLPDAPDRGGLPLTPVSVSPVTDVLGPPATDAADPVAPVGRRRR